MFLGADLGLHLYHLNDGGIIMSQPEREYIANLGDASPIEYGGAFLYEDKTGNYAEELEILEVPEEGEKQEWRIYRFSVEQLSSDCHEWFCGNLASVASFCGSTEGELRAALCSEDARDRAMAYMDIAAYHGLENFDFYPLRLSLKEVKVRYKKELR